MGQILQGFWALRSFHERGLLKKGVSVSLQSLSTKIPISIPPASIFPFSGVAPTNFFRHLSALWHQRQHETKQLCGPSVMGRATSCGEETTDSPEPLPYLTQALHTLGVQYCLLMWAGSAVILNRREIKTPRAVGYKVSSVRALMLESPETPGLCMGRQPRGEWR